MVHYYTNTYALKAQDPVRMKKKKQQKLAVCIILERKRTQRALYSHEKQK